MQILFLLVIFGITKERTDLNKALRRPKFCTHYIIRKLEESGTPLLNIINKIDDTRRKNYIQKYSPDNIINENENENDNDNENENDIENDIDMVNNHCRSLNENIEKNK